MANSRFLINDATNSPVSGASFIPDEPATLGSAVTEAIRQGPFTLAFRDIFTCIRMFTLFPGVINPLYTKNPSDEFYLGWGPNLLGMFLLSTASILGFTIVLLSIPMFVLLPTPVALAVFVGGQALVHVICWPMQGPDKLWSKTPTDAKTIAKYEKAKGERWFFLNGCCVSGHNVQQNVDKLAETFGHPVFAVHNRTYGVLGDLFECIMQRAFNLFTEETRVCYEYVKAYLSDAEVKKVVLIAHSQGCIMASQILDQLYVDLPSEQIAKLEVYTFGNAASHFNNPLRKATPAAGSIDARDVGDVTNRSKSSRRGSQVTKHSENGTSSKIAEMLPERVIAHIEHYCNSGDMVTRWGALFSAKQILQNRFCGHIFINEGVTGHMLNQHYLSDMFPLHHRSAGAGHASGTSSEAKHHGVPFLDRIVNIDTATVTQRHSSARHQMAVMKRDSKPHEMSMDDHSALRSEIDEIHHSGSGQDHGEIYLKLGEGKTLTSRDLSGAEGSRISVVKRDSMGIYRGKTVRQLSRLWRYLDGADPDDKR